MKDEIDIRAARALVGNGRLWHRIAEVCFGDPSRPPRFHSFPVEDGSRLALLGRERLEEIGCWLEVIARSEKLRRETDGARIRALREAYGDAYPEALRYSPYFAKWPLPDADGLELLATAMRSAPQWLLPAKPLPDADVPLAAVWKLLKLRFPEDYEICCS